MYPRDDPFATEHHHPVLVDPLGPIGFHTLRGTETGQHLVLVLEVLPVGVGPRVIMAT